MIFSKRNELAERAIAWCLGRGIPTTHPVNIVAALAKLGELNKGNCDACSQRTAEQVLDEIADVFGIGSEARKNRDTILANVRNCHDQMKKLRETVSKL